jgi:hypothetical protein
MVAYQRPLSCRGFSTVSKDLHVDLLIGSDYYWSVVDRYTLPKIGRSGPAAVATSIVWVLQGRYEAKDLYASEVVSSCNLALAGNDDQKLDHDLTAFWNLDILGITDSTKSSVGQQGVDFVKNFTDSLVRGEDGRYTAKFIWDENKHM